MVLRGWLVSTGPPHLISPSFCDEGELWGGVSEYLRPPRANEERACPQQSPALGGPEHPGPARCAAARLTERAPPPRRSRRPAAPAAPSRGRASRARRRLSRTARGTAQQRWRRVEEQSVRRERSCVPPRPAAPAVQPAAALRGPRDRAWRDAEPLHNRGNPASTTTAEEAARLEPGPRRRAPVTHCAAPRRGPRGRPVWCAAAHQVPASPLLVGWPSRL